MRKPLLLAVGILACAFGARGQTTQLDQTSGTGTSGVKCTVAGCVNVPLSDHEVISWSDTLRYYYDQPVNGRLAFRALNYFLSGNSSGYMVIDLDASTWEKNGFALHDVFHPSRYTAGWTSGYLQIPNEYIGFDPFLYGYNGAVNVTTGTGQVGLVTPNFIQDQTVTLTSGDTTQVQVPSQVTILAGSLDADFTITATAPMQTGGLKESFITVTATFPDGTVSTATVGVEPLPAPPPPGE